MTAPRLKRWRVSGLVTISINTEVEAATEQEARERAMEQPMQRVIHDNCSDATDCWMTSGELDGEADIQEVVCLDPKPGKKGGAR